MKAYLDALKAGDLVYADAGFTCMEPGKKRIEEDSEGLYIVCDEGKHYLDGQLLDDGSLVGLRTKDPREGSHACTHCGGSGVEPEDQSS